MQRMFDKVLVPLHHLVLFFFHKLSQSYFLFDAPGSRSRVDVLALLVQQVEERCGFLADEVEAAAVVDVVDVVPGDALGPVLLLREGKARDATR